MTARRAALVLPVALAVLIACHATRVYDPEPGRYDRIPPEWNADLWRARFATDGGRFQEAHAILRPLADARPELLAVRCMLQDAELALLEEGKRVGGMSVPDPAKAAGWLADAYSQRADANPSAEGYVLAARLQPRPTDGLELLDQAVALDPGCVWAHYGQAFWNHRLRRFPAAREAIERAFDLDPGHMPTMRLHASMQASAGETQPAIDCLLTWLKRGETDPTIDPRERAEAQIDLAALLVLDGLPEDALALLDAIDRDLLREPARSQLVRAVALADLGRHALALSAARRAKEENPEDVLPLVYQALILEREGNVSQERAAWEALLAEVHAQREADAARPLDLDDPDEFDFPTLLIQLRAQARLERLDRERARRP